MRPGFPILLISLLSFPLFLQGAFASETRVAATGGLTTLLDDETTDLNLFLDGNPAGLLYLNTKDRFDLSGEFSVRDQAGPSGPQETALLATLPDPAETLPSYGGVMVFPDPHWAFQAQAQFMAQKGFPAPELLADDQVSDRYLGILRGSYGSRFAVFGVEIAQTQTDKTYAPGSYDVNYDVLSGSAGEGSTRVKVGAGVIFPDDFTAEQTRFHAGVYWGTKLGTDAETRAFQVDPLGPPSFSVTQVWTVQDAMEWGGEITMEIPSILKVMLDVHERDAAMDMTQTSGTPVTFTPTGTYPPFRTGDLGLDLNFRSTLSGFENEDLKLGGGLSFLQNSLTDATAGTTGTFQEFVTRLGIGLDSPRDHLMGFQWTGVHTIGGTDRYQMAFGGEKSVGPTWALRLGLTGEIDHANGASHDDLDTVLDMGAGFEEAFGRVDLRFRLGQTVNMSDSSDLIGLIEGQVTGTLFL